MIASSAAFQQVAATSQFTTYVARAVRLRREQRLAPGARHAARRTAPQHPRPRAAPPARAHAAADRRSRRQARGQERAAVPRGRAVQHHPVALRTPRRQVARGPHLARHLLHRRQRDRGRRSCRRSSPSSTPRPTRSGSAASGAANGGLTPYQALVSASLIEAEAGTKDDAPLISAVIVNRLKEDMPLQIDATLCYAKGGCPPVPTDADRKIDSPYNTYKVKGLPPTPIKTVSEVALRAALDPAPVPFKYYVSDAQREDLLRDHAVGAREERGQGARWRLTTPRAAGARSAVRERGRVGRSSSTATRRARAPGSRTSRTSSRSRRWCCTTAAPSRRRSPGCCTTRSRTRA